MLRTQILVFLVVALAGATACKKEVAPETSAAPAPRSVADKFAGTLGETEFINYDIAIGGGGSLTYHTLRFDPDGTWTGVAVLKLTDEPFDCEESGSWEIVDNGPIDALTSRLLMNMTATDCPGREAPREQKVEVRIKGQSNRPQIIDL